jgi:hypothetical protein
MLSYYKLDISDKTMYFYKFKELKLDHISLVQKIRGFVLAKFKCIKVYQLDFNSTSFFTIIFNSVLMYDNKNKLRITNWGVHKQNVENCKY